MHPRAYKRSAADFPEASGMPRHQPNRRRDAPHHTGVTMGRTAESASTAGHSASTAGRFVA